MAPLDEYFAGDITKDDFIPTLVDFATHEGELYGVPIYPWTWNLYWNKAVFQEAGLDPDSPPTTIDELDEYIHQVTKLSEEGFIESIGMMPFANWDVYQWFYYFGGSIYNEETDTLTLNHPKNVEMLEWMTSLVAEWGVKNVQRFRGAQGAYDTENYQFWTGRLTFDLMGLWNFEFINRFKPDLEWGVAAPSLVQGVPEGCSADLRLQCYSRSVETPGGSRRCTKVLVRAGECNSNRIWIRYVHSYCKVEPRSKLHRGASQSEYRDVLSVGGDPVCFHVTTGANCELCVG